MVVIPFLPENGEECYEEGRDMTQKTTSYD